MDTSKLAVVYVRVSTRYQVDNYSVQDQRNLAHLATRYGFAAVDVREEQGVSAETITARPVMKRLLEEIAQGHVGAIIVSSFTRLTRDIDDIDAKSSRRPAATTAASSSPPTSSTTSSTKPTTTSPTSSSSSPRSRSA